MPTAPRRETFRDIIRDSYLTFDRRTLGLTRICLAVYLIFDLFRRTPDWLAMFSDTGVLPSSVVLAHPQAQNFTLLLAFQKAPELWALWGVILFTYTMLLVGWRTKIWQVLSLLFVTSMNGRVLLIENGGYVVQNLVLLWTAFLPLGDRFSLDALRTSLRRRREGSVEALNDRASLDDPARISPFVSLVGIAISLQFGAIYYFNVVHKTGPAWHNGTAVHFVLYNDRMATPIVAALRTHVPFWLIKIATPLVLTAEAAIAFCVLLPRVVVRGFDTKKWMRRLAIFLICLLHIGFGSSFVLGPFAWALCVFSTVMFSSHDWESAISAMRRTHRARTLFVDAQNLRALALARLLVRFDRFALLTFTEPETGDERSLAFGLRRDSGEIVGGSRALAEAIRATPLGTLAAWLLAVPGPRHLADAYLRSVARGPRLDEPRATLEEPVAAISWLRRAPSFLVREGLVALMLIAAVNQALVELWSTRNRWNDLITSLNQTGPLQTAHLKLSPQPEILRTLSQELRFLQGWFMFSPNPVMDDGTIVVDAVTKDGRHLDPFSLTAPNFDLMHVQSCRYNQIWSDYFNRMHYGQNSAYRDAMVEYMRRLPDRTGNGDDQLVRGDVYWVSDWNPKWGTRESWGQKNDLLFSFDATGPSHAPRAQP
ncbi:MAG: hypothetical protein U0414_33175 [Polyangiaceae bacterium]